MSGPRRRTAQVDAPVDAQAYALCLMATAAWGLNAVAGKFAVGHISPFTITAARWGLVALAGLPFAWPHLRRDGPVIRQHAALLFAYGAVGFAGFNLALYTALNHTAAINVVIEQAGVPGVIFALNLVFFRQRVAGFQLVGFALTVLGVALMISDGQPARLLALDINAGDGLMLVAILCYGGFTAALAFKPAIHWLSFITVLAAAAFITALPFALWEYATGPWITPDWQGIGVAVFAALIPGLVAQSLFIRANELIGGNRAGVFFNLVPVFGTLFAIVLLGEVLHGFHFVALVLVLGGIALAEARLIPKRQRP